MEPQIIEANKSSSNGTWTPSICRKTGEGRGRQNKMAQLKGPAHSARVLLHFVVGYIYLHLLIRSCWKLYQITFEQKNLDVAPRVYLKVMLTCFTIQCASASSSFFIWLYANLHQEWMWSEFSTVSAHAANKKVLSKKLGTRKKFLWIRPGKTSVWRIRGL